MEYTPVIGRDFMPLTTVRLPRRTEGWRVLYFGSDAAERTETVTPERFGAWWPTERGAVALTWEYGETADGMVHLTTMPDLRMADTLDRGVASDD